MIAEDVWEIAIRVWAVLVVAGETVSGVWECRYPKFILCCCVNYFW